MSNVHDQVEYYNAEWSIAGRLFANRLQLARTIEILRELLQTGVQTGAQPPRICDLGSGTGWLTAILGCVGEATGVELSDVAVEIASSRFSHVGFECGDVVHDWVPAHSSYDLVVSHEVIEHIEEQQRYLDAAFGVLKPGGWLILTTPNARTVEATPVPLRSHQPIENVLTHTELDRLLRTRFENVAVRSILLGGGTKGAYRIVNSGKMHGLLRRVGLDGAFTSLALAMNYGLHLIARAQKPVTAL